MKSVRVSILAWAIMSGGVITAAAQPYYNVSDTLSTADYPLHEQFTNAPRFVYTAGLPTLTAGLPTLPNADLETLSGAVLTDGAGHIAGLVYARLYFDGPANHTNNYGAFTITVTGSTSNRGTNPLVKIILRGSGYTFDGVTNHPNASLSLTFTSTNKLVDVPSAPPLAINSTNYAVTYADGSMQVFSDGPATRTNSAYTFLSGPIRGNIQRGQNGAGKQLTVTQPAALFTAGSIWTVVNGTNFVEQELGGGLVLDVLTNLDAQVIQLVPGSRLYLNATIGSPMEPYPELYAATGSASTNSLKWSAGFAGVAFAHGSTLQTYGTLGPAIVAYEPTSDTNNYPSGFIPQVVPYAIQNMTNSSGKFFGQRVLNKQMQGVSVWPTPPGS